MSEMMSHNVCFFHGAGSILDLGGTYYHHPSAPRIFGSDADALRSDWETIGRDMASAIEIVHNQLSGNVQSAK